ncbi:hypothetical protein SDC9_59552 [bioreactor metagenome]|uniref:Uncharacterized protein n=1 Tax=bioreactor metagenome TaxID=1076179 RepID=A0A644XBA5_9ZZZZ
MGRGGLQPEQGLAADLPLGLGQLGAGDAVGQHVVQHRADHVDDLLEPLGGAGPFDADLPGIGVGDLAGVDAVGEATPLAHLDEQSR